MMTYRSLKGAGLVVIILLGGSLAAEAAKDPRSVPPEAVQAYQKGVEFKRAKRYDNAAQSLLEAINLCRHFAEAHWALAWVAELRGDLATSVEAFRNAVNHDVTGEFAEPSSRQLQTRDGEIPYQVWRMQADGSQPVCFGLPCLPAANKNGELAFTWKYEDMDYPDLWLANQDGEVIRNLTNTPRVWERSWAWSPDGEWLAYTWQQSGIDYGLSLLNIVTKEEKELLEGHYADAPDFSPDGELIVYQEDYQIWIIKVDGSGRRALTPYGQKARNPRFSPAGDLIYFDYRARGTWSIYSLEAEGGTPVPVVKSAGHDFAPSISADGLTLLFTSTRAQLRNSDVWVMNLEDQAAQKLTHELCCHGPATWSADGEQIYYYRQLPVK